MNSSETLLPNIRNRFKNRQIGSAEKAGIIILSLALGLLIAFSLQHRYELAFQYDYSVNWTFGLLDYKNKHPQKGQYVAFYFQAVRDDPRYGQRFVKKLGCVEGEYLRNSGRDFYCNDKPIGTAKKFSFDGKPLPVFEYDGVIPKGYLFAVGENISSYDSKIWGFVPQSAVIGTVTSFF